MSDWLDAAAEVGGAVVAVCLVIFLVVLLATIIGWWRVR